MKSDLQRTIMTVHSILFTMRVVAFRTSAKLRKPIIFSRSLHTQTQTLSSLNDNLQNADTDSAHQRHSTQSCVRQYQLIHTYPIDKRHQSLPRFLHRVNPKQFPSVSQAKKACRFGVIVVFTTRQSQAIHTGTENTQEKINSYLSLDMFVNKDEFEGMHHYDRTAFVASPETVIEKGDIIAVRTRIKDSFYSTSCTGYIDPPQNQFAKDIDVIYEDDHIGVVNKPEFMSTIGEKRQDLQSCLPFHLCPPLKEFWGPNQSAPMIPRPVHRLDRRTSGIVLVAKTKSAMSILSARFRVRDVEKSYTAIVFGKPNITHTGDYSHSLLDNIDGGDEDDDENESSSSSLCWQKIDYPIDGKSSITLWRTMYSIESPIYGTLTVILCKPKTGRYHQIRRHLSYCLGTPIVGDNKYDKGRDMGKSSRSLGMFLCSNAITFKHPCPASTSATGGEESASMSLSSSSPFDTRKSSFRSIIDEENREEKVTICHVEIPLPAKFKDIMGLNPLQDMTAQ